MPDEAPGSIEKLRGMRIVAFDELPPKLPDNHFSEADILEAACYACGLSDGHAVLIGGQTTMPAITGGKRYRPRSSELDMVVDGEGLDALLGQRPIRMRNGLLIYHKDALPCYFFHGDVKGVPASFLFEDVRTAETEAGRISYASPEKTTAMKFRRGAMKGGFYGKDALDFYALAVAGMKQDRELGLDEIGKYVQQLACPNCTIGENRGCFAPFYRCLANMGSGADAGYAATAFESLKGRMECRY